MIYTQIIKKEIYMSLKCELGGIHWYSLKENDL